MLNKKFFFFFYGIRKGGKEGSKMGWE